MGQTQETIRKKLEEKDEFECTVIEVKVIEGLGTTVDVVLVNGIIKVGDTMVLSGMMDLSSRKSARCSLPTP